MKKTKKQLSDYERHKALVELKDEDIDFSDIPLIDEAFIRHVQTQQKKKSKIGLHIRIQPEVLEWYQGLGKGYQSFINTILESYMKMHTNMVLEEKKKLNKPLPTKTNKASSDRRKRI